MGQHKHLRGGGLVDDTAFVCDSVYVAGTATVGARSYVGHGAYINAGVTVGTDCIICDRVRVTANVANGTTVLCDCCGSDGAGGDMILLATVFAFDGFVPNLAGETYAAAPGSADWELVSGTPPQGVIPVNSFTGLATVPVHVQLSIWVHDQDWDNDNLGNMTYQLHLHDGTVLGTGVYPAHSTVTGKLILFDTELLAGIIDANAGLYVTWTPLTASAGGVISQRLTLAVSAVPPP